MGGWGEGSGVPFVWCQSILFSSLRAWVRFSSWSWRWMFSSIRAWIVSWSSKPWPSSTSRVRKKSAGLSPLIMTKHTEALSFLHWQLLIAFILGICIPWWLVWQVLWAYKGGWERSLIPKPWVESCQRGCFKIHQIILHKWTQQHKACLQQDLIYMKYIWLNTVSKLFTFRTMMEIIDNILPTCLFWLHSSIQPALFDKLLLTFASSATWQVC